MKQRFVLLHYHIFKNAGSTLDWALQRNFGTAFNRLDAKSEMEFVSNEEIVRFLLENPQIVTLSSHNFSLPSPTYPLFKFVEICFVRHPLDRLQSMYYHFRRTETEDTSSIKARHLSMPDFLSWLVETQPFNAINAQTCIFATGGDYYFPPSPVHLQVAVARMKEIKLLGIVEHMDESLVAGEFFLRPIFPKLDLSYVVQNVHLARKPTLEERLAEMKESCGDAVFSALERSNQLDLELWVLAKQELDRRLAFVPHLTE